MDLTREQLQAKMFELEAENAQFLAVTFQVGTPIIERMAREAWLSLSTDHFYLFDEGPSSQTCISSRNHEDGRWRVTPDPQTRWGPMFNIYRFCEVEQITLVRFKFMTHYLQRNLAQRELAHRWEQSDGSFLYRTMVVWSDGKPEVYETTHVPQETRDAIWIPALDDPKRYITKHLVCRVRMLNPTSSYSSGTQRKAVAEFEEVKRLRGGGK